MNKQPLVSVLMTAYNREKYIAEAIESVLASTYRNFELIIVDDASTDSTVKIAREYEKKDSRVRVYVNEKNLGDYPNRNRAASYAKGEYLKYLDSDDMIFPPALEVMVKDMEFFPKAAIGFISIGEIHNGQFCDFLSPKEAYREYFYRNGLLNRGPSATIIRRSVFIEYDGFSNEQYLSDTNLWLKVVKKYPVVLHQPNLFFWRQHTDQQIAFEQKDNLIEYKRYYDILNLLNSDNLPIDDKEVEQIKQNIKNIKARSVLKNLVTGKIKRGINKYKMFKLTLTDLLKSFKKNVVVETKERRRNF